MAHPLSTIIDNREGNTVLAALKRLLPQTENMDVATGLFEIVSLLALDSFDELRNSLKIIEHKKVRVELRNMQALAREKATLVCWMEVC